MPTPTPTSTASATSPNTSPTTLDWDSFLRMRRLRRRYNLAGSIFSSIASTAGSIGYLFNIEIDPTQLIFGMDPLIVFGLATAGCGTVGWLVGPSIGGAAFKIVKGRWLGQIAEKENQFLKHIKKNRVDPSFQSFSNPVPDYYGEKIGSVKQYRQWLKDQRAYNKKREAAFL
ncbi:mitochondrial import protein Pam17 [Sphaerosporella brunnea]|uniref:Presequence translocated-associated motor subunit PAM17 n=1 Tax=Sphaerosporella brunnea TaxID=1250544 RepID=A0A5J5ETS6_9PEZI|nr:mitochondrial import protein Pam17 [Sphaerosporella brunnea]